MLSCVAIVTYCRDIVQGLLGTASAFFPRWNFVITGNKFRIYSEVPCFLSLCIFLVDLWRKVGIAFFLLASWCLSGIDQGQHTNLDTLELITVLQPKVNKKKKIGTLNLETRV